MQAKLLNDDGQRTYALVLETGDEVMEAVQAFARRERLKAAQFSAIGAFQEAVLCYFDWKTKKYLPNPIREQVEVASLTGDIAIGPEGSNTVHMHAVLGRSDGTAMAGHLAEGRVRPTLEIVLTESPSYLQKQLDPDSGLALIKLTP